MADWESFMGGAHDCVHMGAEYKNVRLSREAYESLKGRKREDETFSEVVERLATERPIRDLAGVFSDEAVESVREGRRKAYREYGDDRERRWEE